jgi:hypothetical protein
LGNLAIDNRVIESQKQILRCAQDDIYLALRMTRVAEGVKICDDAGEMDGSFAALRMTPYFALRMKPQFMDEIRH